MEYALSKDDNGMLTYEYMCSVDCGFCFHTLAEVGAPYQQWFRDEIKLLGWTVEFGCDIDVSPYVADFVRPVNSGTVPE